jgi:hypothetical protein
MEEVTSDVLGTTCLQKCFILQDGSYSSSYLAAGAVV